MNSSILVEALGEKNITRKKLRLDQLIVQRGMAESREKAKALIMAGDVLVDGVGAEKPGHSVSSDSDISIKTPLKYVSRGGLKLEAGLYGFSVNVRGLTILDIGASTGGFTDCLLQHGAEKVIAVDVGYGQFHWKLRHDKRVTLLEKTNARYLKQGDLEGNINGAVIDVSFISLELIVPPLSKLLCDESFIIALIKPQFEVGKHQVGKGGIVRDPALHDGVNKRLTLFFEANDWNVIGLMPSPVLGPKGNREFMIYLRR